MVSTPLYSWINLTICQYIYIETTVRSKSSLKAWNKYVLLLKNTQYDGYGITAAISLKSIWWWRNDASMYHHPAEFTRWCLWASLWINKINSFFFYLLFLCWRLRLLGWYSGRGTPFNGLSVNFIHVRIIVIFFIIIILVPGATGSGRPVDKNITFTLKIHLIEKFEDSILLLLYLWLLWP